MNTGAEYLTWPAVVLILGIIIIFVFRQSLADILRRTHRISKHGLETEHSVGKGHLDDSPSGSEDPTYNSGASLILQLRNFVQTEVERQLSLRYLHAGATMVEMFERIRARSPRSHIITLEYLDSLQHGAKIAMLKSYFDQAVTNNKNTDNAQTFDQWLEFFQESRLIIYSGGMVAITPAGRAFLSYLFDQGYTSHRLA